MQEPAPKKQKTTINNLGLVLSQYLSHEDSNNATTLPPKLDDQQKLSLANDLIALFEDDPTQLTTVIPQTNLTALDIAVFIGQFDLIEKTVATLAATDIQQWLNRKIEPRCTALTFAVTSLPYQAVKLLYAKQRQQTLTSADYLTKLPNTAFTLLHLAAHYGETMEILFVIEDIPAEVSLRSVVDIKSDHGLTPLSMAAMAMQFTAAKFLATGNKPISADDYVRPIAGTKLTLLHIAAFRGELAAIKDFIAKKSRHIFSRVDLNIQIDNGDSLMVMAIKGGQLDVVKLLHQNGVRCQSTFLQRQIVELDQEQNQLFSEVSNIEPLLAAAYFGRVEILNYLLATAKVPINTKIDDSYKSALECAIIKDQLNVVRRITEEPGLSIKARDIIAAINSRAPNSATILTMLFKFQQKNQRLPLDFNFSSHTLNQLTNQQQIEKIKTLLFYYPQDLPSPYLDVERNHPVLYALHLHRNEIATILIKAYPINQLRQLKASSNKNIFHLAAANKLQSVCSHVIKNISEFHQLAFQRDAQMRTPLHYLIENGMFEHASQLLTIMLENPTPVKTNMLSYNRLPGLGQLLSQPDQNGETIIMTAIKTKETPIELIQTLINHCDDVRTKNYVGDTALAIAVNNKHEKAIEFLLQKYERISANEIDSTILKLLSSEIQTEINGKMIHPADKSERPAVQQIDKKIEERHEMVRTELTPL